MDTELVEDLQISIDPKEALEYYQEVKDKHMKYAWNYKDNDPDMPFNKRYNEMWGWGILDSTGRKLRQEVTYFGLAKKIIDYLNVPLRACIATVPPKSFLGLHKDKGVKIHIPLTNSEDSYFFDENSNYFYTNLGSVYLMHTYKLHGMKYNGKDERAHIIISCNEDLLSTIYTKKSVCL